MDRVYQANAIETPPSTTASSGSYPTAGNKAAGQLATVPGPYWFYSITEEIRNALIKAGVTPDASKVNQLADALGKFLPLTGGTVTGNLKIANNREIQTAADDNYLAIYGGTGYRKGSRLVLGGKDNDTYSGKFSLIADDGTTEMILTGNVATGNLVWRNSNVITSGGGTFAGQIVNNIGDLIRQGATDKWTSIKGGTSNSTGGYFTTYGKDHDQHGNAVIGASDGTNMSEVILQPSGSFTLKGKKVVTEATPFAPDYKSAIAVTSGFTAPSAGLILVLMTGSPSGVTDMKVNGLGISMFGSTAYMDRTLTAWVSKGDTVTFNVSGSNVWCNFYPLKASS